MLIDFIKNYPIDTAFRIGQHVGDPYFLRKKGSGEPKNLHLRISKLKRFANSVIQLTNALLIAQDESVSRIYFPKPFWLKSGIYNLKYVELHIIENIYDNSTENEISYSDLVYELSGEFFYVEGLSNFLPMDYDPYGSNKSNCLSPLSDLDCLNFDYSPDHSNFSSDESLTIHIRSGDIFTDNGVNPWYGQPPLDFYKQVIISESPRLISLIAENSNNPVVSALDFWIKSQLDSGYSLFLGRALDIDILSLIHSKKIISSRGTFLSGVSSFANSWEKVISYESKFKNWGSSNPQLCIFKDHNSEYVEKIIRGGWLNTSFQNIMMVEHICDFKNN